MKKQVLQLKEQKPFKLFDVILYAVIAVFIVGLFVAFFQKTDSNFVGVDVNLDGEVIMNYRFENDVIKVGDKWKDKILVSYDGDLIIVKFVFGKDYNVLEIDKAKKCAKMIEANCSYHKECVNNFPVIDSADKFTICAPHKLQIRGVGVSKGEVMVG